DEIAKTLVRPCHVRPHESGRCAIGEVGVDARSFLQRRQRLALATQSNQRLSIEPKRLHQLRGEMLALVDIDRAADAVETVRDQSLSELHVSGGHQKIRGVMSRVILRALTFRSEIGQRSIKLSAASEQTSVGKEHVQARLPDIRKRGIETAAGRLRDGQRFLQTRARAFERSHCRENGAHILQVAHYRAEATMLTVDVERGFAVLEGLLVPPLRPAQEPQTTK